MLEVEVSVEHSLPLGQELLATQSAGQSPEIFREEETIFLNQLSQCDKACVAQHPPPGLNLVLVVAVDVLYQSVQL